MSNNRTPRSNQSTQKRTPGEVSKYVQSEISSRVKESVSALNNFQQNWDKLHLTGMTVLSSIKSLKLESMRNHESGPLYPRGLQERCDHLQNVVNSMESSLANLHILVQQFNALVELNSFQGGSNSIVYLSWSTEKFRQAFQDIYGAYSKEFSLKNAIKEEVAHCSNKESLVYHITCWTTQPFLGGSFRLLCESLYHESNLR